MKTPKRLTVIWLVLLAATGLSWGVGHGAIMLTPKASGVSIIVVSFLKIRLVMLEFMELQHAPRLLRIGCEFWIIGVCSGILLLYRT